MVIKYEIHVEDDLLRVTASGRDESLEEVQQYGAAIVDAARAHNCRRVLCDERELVYALGTFDLFQSAEFITQYAPKVAKTAIVCGPSQIGDGSFWETVVRNRGLEVLVFSDLAQAEAWLAVESRGVDKA